MGNRIKIAQMEPEGYDSVRAMERYLSTTKLTASHKHLIKIRASQINGCAYCINMHTREARKAGETEQRIYLLDAWREVDIYTEEEKAILALTEEVTLIQHHVKDDTYAAAARLFDDHYLAAIIMAIVAINVWNRIAITTQMPPEK